MNRSDGAGIAVDTPKKRDSLIVISPIKIEETSNAVDSKGDFGSFVDSMKQPSHNNFKLSLFNLDD